MNALNRYKYHLLAALILITLLLVGAKTKLNRISTRSHDLPRVEFYNQRNHALQLIPAKHAGMVLAVEGGADMREFILTTVANSLSNENKEKAFEISRAVILESNHHAMDPLFLLAVIATESQFNIKTRGTHGEIGLMQVMPATAKWLAPHSGLPKNFNLEDPAINIRMGTMYLSQLRNRFKNRPARYVGAYNMGSTNVRRLVYKKIEPHIYPGRVIDHYVQLYSNLSSAAGLETAVREIASTR